MELQKFIDIHKQYFESIDGEALVKNCMMLRTIYGLKINGPVGRKYEDLDTRIFENSATSKYIFFEVIGNIFPLIETYDKFNKYKQRFGRGKKMTREERGLKVKELMKKHNCSLGEASKMLKSM